MQYGYNHGVESPDFPIFKEILKAKKSLEQKLEEALKKGKISEKDLLSRSYQPIPATNPEQYISPFLKFWEENFTDFQNKLLYINPRIVFAVSTDNKGYVPVHNPKFSQPQKVADSEDNINFNTAYSRNKRIFTDEV